ncbi:MAG: iron-containing alcohol dehydrogenase [Devosia nanyangense]|uniref:Alcohol dehydrogenase 2 n=1 Tax=Devosia nanyangense TaxID=1228055 RepID=A0A933NYJ3_9HYPH|nr:iron-containing alcohol dehydrogenase [Devosia nanyangense]
MNLFTFSTAKTIVFGDGASADIGNLARRYLGSRVMLVTDPGIVRLGLHEAALTALAEAGVTVTVYSDVEADPPEAVVRAAADAALQNEVEAVIGFGGGSSLDVAKLVALLAVGREELSQIYGVGKAQWPRLPLMLVPTTAGTGSEVTPIAIVTTGTAEKMGVVSPILLPDVALLDPRLTYGLPPHVTAATGIDAMVHAIEAYASASANNNPISRTLAREALRLIGPALERAVKEGDHAARADMLLGSMLAGQAFANSPVAAVHALAYPIGGHFNVPHGLSNALVLPHVLRFNAVTAAPVYAELALLVFPALGTGVGAQALAQGFAEELASLSNRCGLPQRLRDVGIPETALELMARDAMKQTRLLVNNPRPVAEADALAIYRAAF